MSITEGITERQSRVIQAVVGEYVVTGQPVGSHSITESYDLKISSATIRKEMSVLEQMGLLVSPHTSSGRIPTDGAIQFYVDKLVDLYQITMSEKTRLENFYTKAKWQLDQLLQRTAQLLSLNSNSAGVVLAPVSTESIIKRVELISILDNLILAVIVSHSGTIFQKKIQTEIVLNQENLYKISRYLNQHLNGYEIADLQKKGLSFLVESVEELSQELINVAIQIVQSFVYNPPDQEVYIDGEGNFYKQLLETTSNAEKAESIVSEMLDQNFIRDKINHLRDATKVTSQIGINIHGNYIAGISILIKGYSVGGRNIGALGVIGCSRIPYDKLIPTIDYSSILLSNVLEERYDLSSEKNNELISTRSMKLIDKPFD